MSGYLQTINKTSCINNTSLSQSTVFRNEDFMSYGYFHFVACEAGKYGQDCQNTCGNCIGTCDSQTGVCSLGCKPGWVGSKCIEGLL
jgi:hypothetical protein